jgi:hypothetical protein
MPQPVATWYVETAGDIKPLHEAPENWMQLVMSGDDPDQFYFCGEGTTATLIRAVSLPESGEALIPELWVSQKLNNVTDLIQVSNYGKSGIDGRYVLAISYADPPTGAATIVGRSRFEAWDSRDDLLDHDVPENEIMVGTDGNNSRSMLRAIDVTSEVVNPGSYPWIPEPGWWASSVAGGEEVLVYNKELKGSISYLSSELLIVPAGVDWHGSAFAQPSPGGVSHVWYISPAAVIPHDAMVSMAEHKFIFNVRNFFA